MVEFPLVDCPQHGMVDPKRYLRRRSPASCQNDESGRPENCKQVSVARAQPARTMKHEAIEVPVAKLRLAARWVRLAELNEKSISNAAGATLVRLRNRHSISRRALTAIKAAAELAGGQGGAYGRIRIRGALKDLPFLCGPGATVAAGLPQ